jgi:exonuclease III
LFEEIQDEINESRAGRNNGPKCKKNTRAALTVASLNMRGRGDITHIANDGAGNKWFHINQMLRSKKIGVLALQETHMTDELQNDVERTFKRIQMFHCSDPDAPNSKGVAIVLNRDLTNASGATSVNIIPGRAMMVTIPWHANEHLNILAVYAPNQANENKHFWLNLQRLREENVFSKPDIMLGDFNMVEDAIDRLPSHPDDKATVTALRTLKHSLHLLDGWRCINETTKAYSYTSRSNNAHSRIDRIYASSAIIRNSANWLADTPGAFDTDHRMVSVQVVHAKMPFIGKGRYAIPAQMCKDKKFVKEALRLAKELEGDSEKISRDNRAEPHSTRQGLLKKFIDKVVDYAKARGKEMAPRIDREIKELEAQLASAVNDDQKTPGERALQATVLTEKIGKLAGERHKVARTAAAARNHLEGEVISKYWSGINADRAPRDVVTKLRNPKHGQDGEKEFIDTSWGMAGLTKEYHETLQKDGDEEAGDTATREATFTPVLDKVDRALGQRDKAELAKYITRDLVHQAICEAANGKAAGMSGVPSEFWKQLSFMYEMSKESNSPTCDIVRVLTLAFREMEEFGVQKGTDFALGWLCPIFKKSDRYSVANYRPITVLNSEYKIFTKALSIRLSLVVGSIVHEDQAGFIRGRSIFNQVKLAKLIIPYAEATKQCGALVALDQEKAYDKVAHDYLWATLRKFNIPEHFIKTVTHLYTGAETLVIINGVLSNRYTVTRGVRQGDPLSCLLFDIAIEPLACMIRRSHLAGIKVEGCTERILASLFADDTSVVLGPGDRYEDLEDILLTWTRASRGKFNIPKTVIIPIGTPAHRQCVRDTRKLGVNHRTIADNIHVAEEGEPVRLLGAWIGNGVNSADPWGPVLEKVEKNLRRWEKGHPTVEGRRLIVQMIVAGMTQYLTKVQGMPPEIEKELCKRVQTYVWDGRRPTVNATVMSAPLAEGGKKILDLKARNEAIQLTWLQVYLTLDERRPKWAFVADELIRRNIPKAKASIDPKAAIQCFLQKWDPKSTEGMPAELLEMMKVARKYNTAFDALTINLDVKRQMPMWYHMGASEALGHMNNSPHARCLRKNHDVRTVGDAMDLVDNRPRAHRNRRACKCATCVEARRRKCEYPHHCMEYCKKLIATLLPKWNPRAPEQNDGLELDEELINANVELEKMDKPVRFNPSVRLRRSLAEGFRTFTRPDRATNLLAYRQTGRNSPASTTVTVAGTEIGRQTDEIKNGGGAWYGAGDDRNICIRVSGDKPGGSDRALLAVIAKLGRELSLGCSVTIRLSSRRLYNALTKRLEILEDEGFSTMPEDDLMQAAVAALRRRGSAVWLYLIRDAGLDIDLREAQRLASIGARAPNPEPDEGKVAARFSRTGIKLQSASQSLMYRMIMRKRKEAPRRATAMQIDITRWGVKKLTGELPTDKQIWLAIRKPIFLKQERTFLYWTMHEGYKIGGYWQRITNYEHRAMCPVCDEIESMEHILTQCDAPGQKEVWALAQRLFEQKMPTSWPGIEYGTILGSCAADIAGPLPSAQGINRFYKILMITSAQFIWAMRCERRISRGDDPEKRHTKDEIHNRWVAKMNYRVSLDQMLTSETRFEYKALPRSLVIDTWKGALDNEQSLPADWCRHNEVLVGIRPRRPPGRNR